MRAEGWESLLFEHIEQARELPFQWGSHDCALWSARWVEKATGQDHWATWVGKYTTELGAARLMKKRGFDGPEAIVSAHLESRPVLMARRGDLVLNAQSCIGICAGIKSYFLTADGILSEPTSGCVKAWAVG